MSGMTCGKCERLIREAVQEISSQGIKAVHVSKEDGLVRFQWDRNDPRVEQARVEAAIQALVNGKFKVTQYIPDMKEHLATVPCKNSKTYEL